MSLFNNLSKIAKAWTISANPSEKQLKLAEDRYEICKQCPKFTKGLAKTKLEYYKCAECGCPIDKKIFTDLWNACPLEKWIDIENEYFNVNTKSKNIKTVL